MDVERVYSVKMLETCRIFFKPRMFVFAICELCQTWLAPPAHVSPSPWLAPGFAAFLLGRERCDCFSSSAGKPSHLPSTLPAVSGVSKHGSPIMLSHPSDILSSIAAKAGVISPIRIHLLSVTYSSSSVFGYIYIRHCEKKINFFQLLIFGDNFLVRDRFLLKSWNI